MNILSEILNFYIMESNKWQNELFIAEIVH